MNKIELSFDKAQTCLAFHMEKMCINSRWKEK